MNDRQIPKGSQRADHDRAQAPGRQFRLFAVIVDVVIQSDPFFRRLPGMSRAQDNPYPVIFQFFPNLAYQMQPGVVVFHHHIKQGQRNIGIPPKQIAPFRGGICIEKGHAPRFEFQSFQRQNRHIVDVLFIIDNQYFPLFGRRRVIVRSVRSRCRPVFRKQKSVHSFTYFPWAGNCIVNTVPEPG